MLDIADAILITGSSFATAAEDDDDNDGLSWTGLFPLVVPSALLFCAASTLAAILSLLDLEFLLNDSLLQKELPPSFDGVDDCVEVDDDDADDPDDDEAGGLLPVCLAMIITSLNINSL